MTAPFPKNEKHRLEVLWQYEVLDTVPEEIFDDLVELARAEGRIVGPPQDDRQVVDEQRRDDT